LAIGEILRLPNCTRSRCDLPKELDAARTEAAVRDIRKAFGDTIIRRDLFSQGPNGERISDLKPYQIRVLHLDPELSELTAYEKLLKYDRKKAETLRTGVSKHVRAIG
jgi:hypothetical protein